HGPALRLQLSRDTHHDLPLPQLDGASEEEHHALASEHCGGRVERPAGDHITTGRDKKWASLSGLRVSSPNRLSLQHKRRWRLLSHRPARGLQAASTGAPSLFGSALRACTPRPPAGCENGSRWQPPPPYRILRPRPRDLRRTAPGCRDHRSYLA